MQNGISGEFLHKTTSSGLTSIWIGLLRHFGFEEYLLPKFSSSNATLLPKAHFCKGTELGDSTSSLSFSWIIEKMNEYFFLVKFLKYNKNILVKRKIESIISIGISTLDEIYQK